MLSIPYLRFHLSSLTAQAAWNSQFSGSSHHHFTLFQHVFAVSASGPWIPPGNAVFF